MKLHELKANTGAKKSKIRRGRGDASRAGNFSGRGCKGQNARAGGGVRIGFEGGQTPLLRRTPKLKGFKNPTRVAFVVVNFDSIDARFSDGEVVSPETLVEKKILKTAKNPVKILARGALTKKVRFEGVKLSASAEKLSEKLGKVSKKEKPASEEQSESAS